MVLFFEIFTNPHKDIRFIDRHVRAQLLPDLPHVEVDALSILTVVKDKIDFRTPLDQSQDSGDNVPSGMQSMCRYETLP